MESERVSALDLMSRRRMVVENGPSFEFLCLFCLSSWNWGHRCWLVVPENGGWRLL